MRQIYTLATAFPNAQRRIRQDVSLESFQKLSLFIKVWLKCAPNLWWDCFNLNNHLWNLITNFSNSEQLETIKRLEEEVQAKTADLTKLSEELEQQKKKNNVGFSRSPYRISISKFMMLFLYNNANFMKLFA